MANRFVKPDPAIRQGVIRARQGAKGAKRTQGFVAATSLAATLMGWALFSHQDAQMAATAQLAGSTQAAIVQQAAPTTTLSASVSLSTANPVVIAVTRSSR